MTRLTGQRRREAQDDLAAYARATRPSWAIPPIGILILVGLVLLAIGFAVAK